MKIGESIYRVKKVIKGIKEDAFITDRFVYSMLIKYAKLYMKRQQLNQMTGFSAFFKTIPCIDLIDVDTVAACCNVKSGITIKRSKDKLPSILDGGYGPLIRFVGSIDRYTKANRTDSSTYASITKSSNFKYNKEAYYWIIDNYLYIPNVEWDSALMEVIPEGDISYLMCLPDSEKCKLVQDTDLSVPDYLLAEIEQNVIKELATTYQIPTDVVTDDKQSQLR